MEKNEIKKSLYDHLKNSEKKLRIVCDWDEVIQPLEPYACYQEINERREIYMRDFAHYFEKCFWGNGIDYMGKPRTVIEYSPYGSKLKTIDYDFGSDQTTDQKELAKRIQRQLEIKNSPNFYQEAPFLTIAEDLLKLVKEGKIIRLIFLSAYDKRKFPYGDGRKEQIFKETFDKVGYPHENEKGSTVLPCYLELIPFDNETQGQSKAAWIEKNAASFDVVIDDNPNICNSLVGKWFCKECIDKQKKWYAENKGKSVFFVPCKNCTPMRTVIAPYYPAISKVMTGVQDGYYSDVLFVKQEASELKIEDFE